MTKLFARGDNFTRAERDAQIRARFSELLQHIPILYLVALSAFGGLFISSDTRFDRWESVGAAVSLLVVWRLFYWMKLAKREVPISVMRVTLRQLLVYATVISGGFSIWGQHLIGQQPELTLTVAAYGTFAIMGCAFGLLSYPLAAAIPVVILGFPLAARLLLAGDVRLGLVGFCLLLVSSLTLRILILHHRTTHERIQGKLLLEREKSKLIAAEREAGRLARIDVLTDLPNRRALIEIIEAHVRDFPQTRFTLALVDLNGFKPINDVFGHAAGDDLLAGVAQHLADAIPEGATAARMGGDEFAVFVPRAFEPDALQNLGREICEAVGRPVPAQGKMLTVRASCGITTSDEQTDLGELLSRADRALYAAKGDPNCDFQIFSARMLRSHERQIAIERLISTGAAAQDVTVAFQPIFNLRQGGRMAAVEALARWHSPEIGDIGPAEFITLAEQNGAIADISEAVLKRACAAFVSYARPEIVLSYNVSAIQLCDPLCHDRILSILADAGVPPSSVQLEITETAPLADLDIARRNLQRLRDAGCEVALDDFGAGNASLTYLREMQFDVVKLDGSLVRGIVESAHCRQLLKAAIDLCHTMGMRCVAEMVEEKEQLEILFSSGCDSAQGNLLSRPVSALTHLAGLPSDLSSFRAGATPPLGPYIMTSS